MRSIPLALSWQFWWRGAAIAPATAAGFIGFLLLLYGALSMDGLRSFESEVGRQLHCSMCLMSMICCLSIALHVHPTLVRNFTLPVQSATLVAWPMLHGILVSTATYALGAFFVNAIFDAHWPLWGPALFIAGVAVWGQAIIWGLRSSPFCQLLTAAITFGAVVFWFFEMYGVNPQIRYESTGATVLDLWAMVAAIAIAYCLCVWGVACDRCGEGPNLKRIGDWLESQFDRLFRHREDFGSRTQALFLFEWKLKGLVFPYAVFVVASAVVFSCFVWAADARTVVEICIALSAVAVMLGIGIGAFIGHSSDDLAMGNYKSTQPATDTELAYAVLKATAAAMLAGWAVWLAALAIIVSYFFVMGRGDELSIALQHVSANLGPWSLPVFFSCAALTSWAAGALTASACLSRTWLVLGIVYVFGIAVFVFTLGLRFFVSATVHQMVWMGLLAVLAIGATVGTIAAFASCVRWRMIDWRTVGFAASGSATLVALTCRLLFSQDRLTPLFVLFAVGAICLTFAPLAAAPLAVCWNRHR